MTGERLKEIIKGANVTQREIAEKLNITPQAMTSIFRSQDVGSGKIEEIASAMNVPMSYFYPSEQSVGDITDSNVTGVNIKGTDIHINPDLYDSLLHIVEVNQQSTKKFQEQIDKLIAIIENRL